MVLLETIRPSMHILGTEGGGFAIEGRNDPLLFKVRLSMIALGEFWSPQGDLKSPCTDEHRQFIRGIYGNDAEWAILCKMLERVGMKGTH